MAIDHFIWTDHAESQLHKRNLTRADVERAIRDGHSGRQVNEGEADWLIKDITSYGVPFEAIYDHPVGHDDTTARIVSAWRTS